MTLDEAIRLLKQTHVEQILLPVLLQLTIIVIAARICGLLFRKLGQSQVVGEIAAGIALGPSLLGTWSPVYAVFHPAIPPLPPELSDQVFHWIFTTLSQIGLILTLFLVGLEFDFGHLRFKGRAAAGISAVGILVPFALGVAVAVYVHANSKVFAGMGDTPAFWTFALFLGTALSITALPVLGRILIELNIQSSQLGVVAITAAAAGDAVGWILLAAVTAVAQSQFEWSLLLRMLALTMAFCAIMVFAAKPILCGMSRRFLAHREAIPVSAMAALIVVLFACAAATSWIGIFAIFGAFLLGAILSGEVELRRKIERQLHSFVAAFFLPIFFTYTGLRTRIQSLDSIDLWLIFGLVLGAAIAGKLIGCAMAARISGFSSREAAGMGVLMNTRGLMELIVVNVGYDLGVLPESVFCMLVLMALITTFMTTPLLLWLARGTELDELISQSRLRSKPNPAGPGPS